MRYVFVDAHNIIVGSILATMESNMSHGGLWTGGIYGGTRMLAGIARRLSLRFGDVQIFGVFDGGTPQRRLKLLPEYKQGKRAERKLRFTAEQLDQAMRQLDTCYELWQTFGVPCLRMKGYEADDLIYWMTRRKPGSIIVSNDADLLQCVHRNRASVFHPKTGFIVSRENFTSVVDIPPRYYILYRTLVGDKSDNITGVPGCGPKKAKDLIELTQPDESSTPRKQLREVIRTVRDEKRSRKLYVYEQALLTHRKTLPRIAKAIDLSLNPEPAWPVDNLSTCEYVHADVLKAVKRLRFNSFLTESVDALMTFRGLPKNPYQWDFLR